MSYLVAVANGDAVTEFRITEVECVVIENNAYILYDKTEKVLFSSPIDSLVYLSAE